MLSHTFLTACAQAAAPRRPNQLLPGPLCSHSPTWTCSSLSSLSTRRRGEDIFPRALHCHRHPHLGHCSALPFIEYQPSLFCALPCCPAPPTMCVRVSLSPPLSHAPWLPLRLLSLHQVADSLYSSHHSSSSSIVSAYHGQPAPAILRPCRHHCKLPTGTMYLTVDSSSGFCHLTGSHHESSLAEAAL
jgi:hypothetical protein